MKTYKLLYLLMVFVLFATCKKDRKRLFKTKVHGTVIDYFDLKPVEGVKVSVVYTYDFKEYSWPFNYPPPPGKTPPCVEPDTLEQTYTNANGEFELKFPVRKEVDICGISGNVVNEGTNYGYLLIFEKPGTDYFKQYHSLGFANKNNINVLYRIRPLIEVNFIISNNKPNIAVMGQVRVANDFYDSDAYKKIDFTGYNINSMYTIKSKWRSCITPACSIIDSLDYMIEYYYVNEKIIPQKKTYSYEIIY